ncbi:efflux RND transporter periplasmic adaptor subunit [Bradyrhizobium genosp. P]|uniref:efflux RND transporter periplasmic adaptor subunit n=1 Tax=Bradyrhizobium genosp. P TaxID=83641 RepID=UPI003CEADD13
MSGSLSKSDFFFEMQKLALWVASIGAVLSVVFVGMARAGVLADASTCLVKPKQVVQLGSSVFGVLAELTVDRSDPVVKGQVIGKLDTSVEEAQLALDTYRAQNTAALRSAKADMEWNERELARRQKLASNMFSRLNDVDEAATKVAQDKIAIDKAEDDQKIAKLEAARSQAQYNLRLIRSPFNGIVSEVKLQPGEFIYETTPIVTLAQVDPLTVDLVIPGKRYGSVKLGQMAELYLLPPADKVVQARIDVVDPLIDPASDTFRVRLTLPNPDYAIPAGIRCTANLPDAPHE